MYNFRINSFNFYQFIYFCELNKKVYICDLNEKVKSWYTLFSHIIRIIGVDDARYDERVDCTL